jgi:outer membrane immunogenic protein
MVLILLAANAAVAEDFKGAYIGGVIGGASSRVSARTTVVTPGSYFATSSVTAINAVGAQSLDQNIFTGGVEGGYMWRNGDIIFGLEGDFSSFRLDNRATVSAPYPCCAGTGFTLSQWVYTDYLITARGRIGWVHGRALYYVTSGLAATNLNPYGAGFTDSFSLATDEHAAVNEWMHGWTVGAGVEVKATRHLSLKGEYLYADFGDTGVTSTNLQAGGVLFPDSPFVHKTNMRAHIYRGGVNYWF